MGWAALVNLFMSLYRSQKEHKKKGEQKIRDREVNLISPQNVCEECKRTGNKVKYRGYKIRWYVAFFKLESSLIYSQLFLKNDKTIIRTRISLEKYPGLKNEEYGEKYIVEGIIDKVEKNTVYLEQLIELKRDSFFVI